MALTQIGQRRSRLLATVTAIVLTALSHGVAQAIPITQTFSTSIAGTDGASFDTGFERFDPTLGTLTSVSGTLSGSFDYSLTIGFHPITVHVAIGESLSYLDGSAQFGLVFAPFTLIVGEPSIPFAPDVYTVSGTASDSLTKSSNLPALLAYYTGTGSFGGVGAGPIAPDYAVVTGRTLGMTLVYNYTPFDTPAPLPEPSSLALLGLSLAGLALTRRRKQ